MAKKTDKKVKDLNAAFGGANFADILNRLWLMGKDPKELQKALATTSNGTNDPTDIIARLLNKGLVTEDELKNAPTIPTPENIKWAFGPENVVDGVVKPWHTEPYMIPGAAAGGQAGIPNAAVQLPGTTAQQKGQLIIPETKNIPTGKKTIQTVTTPTAEKPKKKPTSPEEIAAYQKEHFGSMLWINQIPEIAEKLKEGAKGEWSAERFRAEVEGTKWWQGNQENVRKWWALKADPDTYRARLEDKSTAINAVAGTWGITLTPEQLSKMSDDAIKFNWDDGMLKRQVVNVATFDPAQGGALGNLVGKLKGDARGFFVKMDDQTAFKQAQQIAAGDMAEETALGNLRNQAKMSYPSLAQMIDQGLTPREAMANQIQTVAGLLEMDPEQVDLSDPKFNSVISYADDKGNVRPMNMDETSKFVKQKDEYWKTGNAQQEVSTMLTGIGRMFGKSAF